MASLKDLRSRISSVKNTRKITSAMKMVAAAKLRRAQEQVEKSRPFAERMDAVLARVAAGFANNASAPKLLAGNGSDKAHLIVLATADRGLCGGFNTNLIREARQLHKQLIHQGKSVSFVTIGRKARVAAKSIDKEALLASFSEIDRPKLGFSIASEISDCILRFFNEDRVNVVTIVYANFRSAITQDVTTQQLIPFTGTKQTQSNDAQSNATKAMYEYEPSEAAVLDDLLPRNVAVQIYRGLLENQASEQGARMTAMDNATRNAGEMIDRLTLEYNRTRQAMITKELIEIVSGAEAL